MEVPITPPSKMLSCRFCPNQARQRASKARCGNLPLCDVKSRWRGRAACCLPTRGGRKRRCRGHHVATHNVVVRRDVQRRSGKPEWHALQLQPRVRDPNSRMPFLQHTDDVLLHAQPAGLPWPTHHQLSPHALAGSAPITILWYAAAVTTMMASITAPRTARAVTLREPAVARAIKASMAHCALSRCRRPSGSPSSSPLEPCSSCSSRGAFAVRMRMTTTTQVIRTSGEGETRSCARRRIEPQQPQHRPTGVGRRTIRAPPTFRSPQAPAASPSAACSGARAASASRDRCRWCSFRAGMLACAASALDDWTNARSAASTSRPHNASTSETRGGARPPRREPRASSYLSRGCPTARPNPGGPPNRRIAHITIRSTRS